MKYTFIMILALIMMSGCNKLNERKADLQLICDPIEANGCIGFAKDKSIMLITEEEI